MKSINCMIIEDEFPAAELLKGYLQEVPNWNVSVVFDNALDAIHYLSTHSVDVVFVDIKLPKLSGISFIRTLSNPPILVITTAYSEHAIEAFELVVLDYLLKPYSFERFLKTVNRINAQLIGESTQQETARSSDTVRHIVVTENRERVRLLLDDIDYIESQKEYVKIVCRDRHIVTKIGIAKMAESLPSEDFIRIHRSFIVNKHHIDSHSKSHVTIRANTLPIGRHYRKEVPDRLH